VVCAARRLDRIEALAKEIDGRAVQCDVTSAEDVAALAAAAGGRVDLLLNNAGGAFGFEPVSEADLDAWRRMFEVNVIGVAAVTKSLLPALIAAEGQIVVMGSTAGQVAYEGGGGYAAAKHAAKAVVDTLRLELFDQPVRVCEIAPGMVKSEGFALTRLRRPVQGRRRLRRRRRTPHRRRHRRHRRLGRHPPQTRQHRPPDSPPPSPGSPTQSPPRPVSWISS